MEIYPKIGSGERNGVLSIEMPRFIDPETALLDRLHQLLREKAFDSQYTIPCLCRDLGISASHLHRKLMATTGKSAVRMIQNLRLSRAEQLLTQYRYLRISEIAFACGFDDPDYFSRLFSKQFGMTPSHFRANTGPDMREKSGFLGD